MDQMVAMRAFVRVAQSGSFQKAAILEGLAQGTVSKRVSALEAHLGCALFRRTQRSISLTPQGEVYYDQCVFLLERVAAADAMIRTESQTPAGRILVSMSPVLSRLVLAPLIAEFVREYPRIEVSMALTEDHVDIVGEGVDLAVRARDLEDSSLIASRLSQNPLSLAAAPDYLKSAPKLTVPEDLTAHDCLTFARMKASQTWRFAQGRKKREVTVSGTLSADQGDTLVELAASGAGVVMMPEWVMRGALREGRLVKVLEEWQPPNIPLHLVYKGGDSVSLRIRLLVDFLKREVRRRDLLPR
ncbi:LysR family transcriptional regulator [uncultured Shimia sp.]|uniref:LysR family transcriptional regulator n=1 Tax=uncultured Shimia sp. TaxID=573152 RepID=UPI0025CCDAEA|nr:LysR family transcriptional regulator [uncultured Shimia sp.]